MRQRRNFGSISLPTCIAVALASICAALSPPIPAALGQTVLRVNDDATAGGNGSTWDLTGPNAAFKFLQDALAAAAPIAGGGTNVEIWVAAGTYRPDESAANPNGTGDQGATFQMRNRVALYGGFAGIEPSRAARQFSFCTNGLVGGQLPAPCVNETILSGDLMGNDLFDFGNYVDNTASIVHSVANDATAVIDGFSVVGGRAIGGGGIVISADSAITIRNCTFYRNEAGYGGAIYTEFSLPSIMNCRFFGNHATSALAAGDGGAVRHSGVSGNVILTNCVFSGNRADRYGGGIYSFPGVAPSSLSTYNCTLTQNLAGTAGGGAFFGHYPQLHNTIIWNNTAPAGFEFFGNGAQILVNHITTINGGYQGDNGSTIIPLPVSYHADPLFVDVDGADNVIGTPDDNLRISPGSGSLELGDNSVVNYPADIDARRRVVDGDTNGAAVVDIGAHEFGAPPYSPVLYVKPPTVVPPQVEPATGDGSSWASAFSGSLGLQAALAFAADPLNGISELWVAAGTYRPALPIAGGGLRSATFQLNSNVSLYGGFSGTETQLAQRDPGVNVTILSGDLNGDDGPHFALNGENSYHLVTCEGVDSSANLDGFTLMAGNADVNSAPLERGGALFADALGGSPTVRRCVFASNSALWYGGAVSIQSGAPTFEACRFVANRASGASSAGGAIYFGAPGLLALTNCEFIGNAADRGGAVSCFFGLAAVNCTFTANHATLVGGNTGRNGTGGALYLDGAPAPPARIENCIISDNLAENLGASLVVWGSLPEIGNSLFDGDNPAGVYGAYTDLGGNILSVDPLFLDADGLNNVTGDADDDLRLRRYSPAVDRGRNAAVPPGVTTDYTGGARVVDGDGVGGATVDMGAYEYSGPPFAGVLYVKQSNPTSGDGTSWASAFKELRDALPIAQSIVAGGRGPVQVWVAAGTYMPYGVVSDPDDPGRAVSFQLNNDLALYGGFIGSETQLSQRNPTTNITVLSGDLNNDDIGALNLADNSLHVLIGSGTGPSTVVDGLTIEAGNADRPTEPEPGGGRQGGGMLIVNGSPTVTNCAFSENVALHGGAVFISEASNPTFSGCRLVDNRATRLTGFAEEPYGGAVSMHQSSPRFHNCYFSDNRVLGDTTYGGGAVLVEAGRPVFSGCTFESNDADALAARGGAMHVTVATATDLVNCRFVSNHVDGAGGALFLDIDATLNAVNCLWVANVSRSGGGIYFRNAGGTLTNCCWFANTENGADGVGGGGVYLQQSSPSLRNCLLFANTSVDFVGELAQLHPYISSPDITYCSVEGWTGSSDNGNNGNDPLFMDPDGDDDVIGTIDDDLRPGSASPAIDSADSLALPLDSYDSDLDGNTTERLPLDLAGQPRFLDDPQTPNTGPGNPPEFVDRGAYEYVANCVTCAGPRLWRLPQDGFFGELLNWTPSLPNTSHEVLFNHRGNTFEVDFDDTVHTLANPVSNDRLVVRNGFVTFDLLRTTPAPVYMTYRLTATNLSSIEVADEPTSNASLSVRDGFLEGVTARVASAVGSIGTLTVTGPNSGFRVPGVTGDLEIGGDGVGTFNLLSGARAISAFATIGNQPSAAGSHVLVSGADSTWTSFFTLLVANGSLEVRDGGTVGTGFGMFVTAGGSVTGDGTIIGDVINFGQVAPGNSPGTLTVTGDYEQVGLIPELGANSGSLRMEIAGTAQGQRDQLSVGGAATLGGGLFVTFTGDFGSAKNPVPAQLDLPLLAAGSVGAANRFDVAFFPGITGNRFLKLEYLTSTNGGPRGGDIVLTVADLQGEIDLNDPDNASVPGLPNAVAVGDLNGDGMQDLVLTVPDADDPATAPGSAFVLLTAFGAGGAYTPVTTQYTVGVEPSAVAVGHLDDDNGASGADIAIANAGDDNVTILRNNGAGGFSVLSNPPAPPPGTVPAGDHPRGICIADFDQVNGNDIAVTLDGDDNNPADDGVTLQLHGPGKGIIFVPLPGGTIPTAPRPRHPRPFDGDNDKDFDLVFGSLGSPSAPGDPGPPDSLGILVSNGGAGDGFGFLPAPVTLNVGREPVQFVVGDLNPAGGSSDRPDIVTVNRNDGTVSVLVNTTSISGGSDNITFAPAVDLPARTNPTPGQPDLSADARSITILDLDQDNDLDVVLLARSEPSIPFPAGQPVARVLRNDLSAGQLAFAPATDLAAGSSPLLLAAADLNADTRDDLVVIDDQSLLLAMESSDSEVGRYGTSVAEVGRYGTSVAEVGRYGTSDPEVGRYGGDRPAVAKLGHADVASRDDRASRGGGSGRIDIRLNAPAPKLTLGDLNCDGLTDILDINPFVLALSDPAAYQQQFPICPIANGDINMDGNTDVLDINPFVALLTGG
ncbi:hypothetical protein RAS1_40940 [Phycisphaerae bacterium RAS1]|nr:hypothetical protein RAS1_40940 [Phycisphaerae bacterium RAS1]